MSGRDRYLPDVDFWSDGDAKDRAFRKATALVADAKSLHQQKRFEGAIEACRRAVALCPELATFHNQLAEALTRRHDYLYNPHIFEEVTRNGDLDEAIHEWREAIRIGWTAYGIQLSLGNALRSKGQYEEAAKHIRLATDLKTREDYPQHWSRYGDSGESRGPDFLIIGATKCGTTSLYEYMKEHPQVLPAIVKEIEYYQFPERGRDWYLAHFPRIPDGKVRFITGEASTCYMAVPDCQNRVFADYPQAQLIALVRDPIDKAISHFHHDRAVGFEHRTIEEAFTQELDYLEAQKRPWRLTEDYWSNHRGYVWSSVYADFLGQWLTVFPKEQLLVLPSDDLYGKPAETMARVYAYLGLPNHRLAQYDVHYKGNYEKTLAPRVRERLARFFAPHNARLEEMIGRRLQWQAPERSTPRVKARAKVRVKPRAMQGVHVQ
jgi:tetratricopeptide (TPR) repeat protein